MAKTVKSFKDFSAKLIEFGIDKEEFIKLVDSSAAKSGSKIVKDVKASPPFTNRTGLLTRSQMFKQDKSLQLTFENHAKSPKGKFYASYLHDGTFNSDGSIRINAMKWFVKGWEKELPNFIKDLMSNLREEFKL